MESAVFISALREKGGTECDADKQEKVSAPFFSGH